MDWLTFIVQMTRALAWPMAAVVLAIVLRRQLLTLISLIRHLKYGDLEIDFEKEIRIAESLAGRLPKTLTEQVTRRSAIDRERLMQLAKLSPSGAIMAAAVEVEQALMEAGQRQTLFRENEPATRDPIYIARALVLRQKLDWTSYQILTELMRLRNVAAHSAAKQITEQQAVEFINLADRLTALLETL